MVVKRLIFVLGTGLSICSCATKALDPDTLPKDISLKPKDSLVQSLPTSDKDSATLDAEQNTLKTLKALRKQIDSLSNSETCTNPNTWRLIPMGEKPCGGPERYLAYPKSQEHEIVEKVQQYTRLQNEYLRDKHLTSDCIMVLPPSQLQCKDGKPDLIYEKPKPQ